MNLNGSLRWRYCWCKINPNGKQKWQPNIKWKYGVYRGSTFLSHIVCSSFSPKSLNFSLINGKSIHHNSETLFFRLLVFVDEHITANADLIISLCILSAISIAHIHILWHRIFNLGSISTSLIIVLLFFFVCLFSWRFHATDAGLLIQ